MTRRPVDIGQRPVTPVDPGAAPDLAWIEVAALVIDEAYQRPLDARSWARIEKIAAAFHWSKFSPMMVARLGNGTFAVIDGQHRAHAAALCGLDRVPALIVPPGVGLQAEAQAFVAVNSTAVPLSPQGLYRAALAVGDEWAVRLRDAVAAAGLDVATSNAAAGARKPFVIYSIATLRALTDAGQAQAVTNGLAAIKAYDAHGRTGLYDAFILKPWLRFVADNPVPVPVLTRVLERRDPFKVLESAQRAVGPGKPYAHEAIATWSAMARDIGRGAAA